MSKFSTITLLIALIVISANAFVPVARTGLSKSTFITTTRPSMFNPDEEPKKLTRDNEPEDYFATNMDKMSDGEKLPVAIAGLVFISLPFVAGMIALYAAK